jgi:hypothetical protein
MNRYNIVVVSWEVLFALAPMTINRLSTLHMYEEEAYLAQELDH